MLSVTEIARGTQGAVRVLQLDPGAPFQYDNTPEGCLRSFRVIALAAPLYAFYILIHYTKFQTAADEYEVLLVEGLRYLVDWLLYPVLFYEIARRRGWLDRYPRYITLLNWINLPAIIIAVIGTALASIAPGPLAALLVIAMQGLFFFWFLAATRLSLGVSWPMAGALLLINWMPMLLLSLLVDRILGVTKFAG
ncbi:MAG TPA: hypothetical protein VEC14_09830 [Reyranellaceae bacterium]|nr:hypothetical protein [Reyranellaceae bacterium]